jgi:hypothetical protein
VSALAGGRLAGRSVGWPRATGQSTPHSRLLAVASGAAAAASGAAASTAARSVSGNGYLLSAFFSGAPTAGVVQNVTQRNLNGTFETF